jgi:hypothetical protein
MAAALLTTSFGFTAENAHAAKKIDGTFAITCNNITRDTNAVVNETTIRPPRPLGSRSS